MFHRHFHEFVREKRVFEKGDFKYVILDLLRDKPRHGYEIIKALEGSFHGFYAPSAGTVYPTLQMLEDMGYVSSAERDGKRVYTISDEGRKFLDQRQEVVDKIKEHMRCWGGDQGRHEMRQTWHEFRRLGRLLGGRAHRLDSDRMARIRRVISRACSDIETILEQ